MKKLLSMVLCAMMALTLAGCGGSGGDSSTYTFSSELDIKNLDSSDADDGCSFTAMHAVIDGLMKTDKKGNVVNGVASSSEVSDDGLTHTYKIRKDAKWANGDPVTANDFVYAWHRIFQKKGQYYYMFCDGIASIVGAQEMSDKIDNEEDITDADLDAMGAAVGIFDICKSCGKSAHIVLDDVNDSIEEFVKRVKKQEYYKGVFVTCEDAIKNCNKDTVVIVVDTHRPSYTECQELLNIAKKVIVIDHHRRGVEFIKDTVLLFHEIYVSSTCEMVTELIQYLEEDVKINKLTAEGLLAGINLDTKFFAFKTGVRTFEAASYLKKIGADTVETKMLFKSNVEDFIARADIIKNTKIINKRICIAYSESEISNINVVIAKAADELLNIKNVEASFILGHKNDTVFISARSLGQINVHVLMEKLGGGGHIDIAGAQLKNVTLNQAYKKVHQIIEEYLEEENQ